MTACAHCGNESHNTFQVTQGDTTLSFDSFQCAISRLAPVCACCAVRILGHVVEAQGRIFCSAQCARKGLASGDMSESALEEADELLADSALQAPAGVAGARSRVGIAAGPASFPEGPNVADSPLELEAARGHLPQAAG